MAIAEPDLFDERLVGTVERVLYEHPDSRWAVVRLGLDGGGEATVVGDLAPVFEGERLEIEGAWVDDRRFGRQFRAAAAPTRRPLSARGLRRYLASGVLPGIGEGLAGRLVEEFGEETLTVLDEQPERLLAVRGIGRKRLAAIREAWKEQAAERATRIFLQGVGLGGALAERIVRAWGQAAERRIRDNPYELASSPEISGIGFRRADAIARQLPGWVADTEARARAAVLHVLDEAAGQGHCFVPYATLLRWTARLLEVEDDAIVRRAVAALLADRHLVGEALGDGEAEALGLEAADDEAFVRAVYRSAFHGAEERVARRLVAIATKEGKDGLPGALPVDRCRRAVDWVEGEMGIELGGDQRLALERALGEKILLVTGGPGTGKTTLIDALARCARVLDARLALAAPTGRAAKRLSEATGHEAQTIHRLLEYRPPVGFTRGVDRPLKVDVLVVDEASMIDIFLMDALVAALPVEASFLMVGDADQLPPVGPGAVLRDLLASDRLPTARLTEIYRQARRSLIVTNAHRVNRGEMPRGLGVDRTVSGRRSRDEAGGPPSWRQEVAREPPERDFYFIDEGDGDRARELVVELVARRIPARFGFDARRDIQVVSPMHRGRAGVARLNAALQRALNPHGAARRIGDLEIRVGDRVLQQRNDYDREVFNGDIGWVVAAPDDADLVVEFEGRRIDYDTEAGRDLALAYAISIHKSQGSEYPAVVVVLLPEHHVMLQRNLLYTALTRARRLSVLLGSRGAVSRAVRNAEPLRRCTRLAHRVAAAQAASGSRPGGGPGKGKR